MRDSRYLHLTDGSNILIRFSIGIAIYGEDGNSYPKLLKAADIRMYEDKIDRKKAPT